MKFEGELREKVVAQGASEDRMVMQTVDPCELGWFGRVSSSPSISGRHLWLETKTPLVLVAPEQVVITDSDVEQVAGSYARRTLIIILSSRQCWKHVTAEESCLRLLVSGQTRQVQSFAD